MQSVIFESVLWTPLSPTLPPVFLLVLVLFLRFRQIVSDETNVYKINTRYLMSCMNTLTVDELHEYVTVSQNFPWLVLISTLKIKMESNLKNIAITWLRISIYAYKRMLAWLRISEIPEQVAHYLCQPSANRFFWKTFFHNIK